MYLLDHAYKVKEYTDGDWMRLLLFLSPRDEGDASKVSRNLTKCPDLGYIDRGYQRLPGSLCKVTFGFTERMTDRPRVGAGMAFAYLLTLFSV